MSDIISSKPITTDEIAKRGIVEEELVWQPTSGGNIEFAKIDRIKKVPVNQYSEYRLPNKETNRRSDMNKDYSRWSGLPPYDKSKGSIHITNSSRLEKDTNTGDIKEVVYQIPSYDRFLPKLPTPIYYHNLKKTDAEIKELIWEFA